MARSIATQIESAEITKVSILEVPCQCLPEPISLPAIRYRTLPLQRKNDFMTEFPCFIGGMG